MSTMDTATVRKQAKQKDVWKLTMTAMLSAIAFILMFLEFSVPVMPAFIKMDLSELPALVAAFAMGPVSGMMVCLIKNLLHLFMTTTGGVGSFLILSWAPVLWFRQGWFTGNGEAKKALSPAQWQGRR